LIAVAIEIERKFLTVNDSWRGLAERSERMSQGYLGRSERASVRIRVGRDQAWLNLKGMVLGAARDEFDYAVPIDEGREILARLSTGATIDKTRHWVSHAGFVWEVDEFHGENDGLIVAEIELDAVDQAFERPDWIGDEVTDLIRYYNVSLALHPYSSWTDEEKGEVRQA
jgi:adenylate cyclase